MKATLRLILKLALRGAGRTLFALLFVPIVMLDLMFGDDEQEGSV